MKSQVIPNFLVKFSVNTVEARGETDVSSEWELFVDGSLNANGSGAGILLKNMRGDLMEHSLRFSFQVSNNKAEYEALIVGLGLGKKLEATILKILSDS